MKLYISGRQLGKTTTLIKRSAETGAVIVVPNVRMARYTFEMAKELGLDISEPITPMHYISRLANGGLEKSQTYLIDELQTVLSRMNVDAATLDIESAEYLYPFDDGEVMKGEKLC